MIQPSAYCVTPSSGQTMIIRDRALAEDKAGKMHGTITPLWTMHNVAQVMLEMVERGMSMVDIIEAIQRV